LELFGFVGLTERYDESIELINYYYNIGIEKLHMNKSKESGITVNDLDNNTLDIIKKENSNDIALYQKACEIFDKRLKSFRENIPYTHIWIQDQAEYSIRGVAFNRNDKVASVKILDGKQTVTVEAKNLRQLILYLACTEVEHQH